MDLGSIQKWNVTASMEKLALVDQAGDIQIVDLSCYCELYPTQLAQTISKPSGKSSSDISSQDVEEKFIYLSTCEYGDIPWRKKLFCVHETESAKTKKVPVPVSEVKERRSSKKFLDYKKKSKTKITGFQAKSGKKRGTTPDKTFIVHVLAPEEVKGYSVESLCLDEGHITVVYLYNDQFVLCQCKIKDLKWKVVR